MILVKGSNYPQESSKIVLSSSKAREVKQSKNKLSTRLHNSLLNSTQCLFRVHFLVGGNTRLGCILEVDVHASYPPSNTSAPRESSPIINNGATIQNRIFGLQYVDKCRSYRNASVTS